MLKIIFVSPHSDPEARLGEPDSGGQCVYENELAKELSQLNDVQVTTYCRKNFNRPAISNINNNYTIKRIVCGGEDFIPKENLEKYLNEFSEKVFQDLEIDDHTIIHGHYWDGGKASLLLKHLSKKHFPIFWTPHSLGISKRKNFKGLENEIKYNFIPRIYWESLTMTMSDNIIVSTDEEKRNVMRDYHIEEKKIEAISAGIDIKNFIETNQSKARQKLGMPQDGKILVTLGRLDKRKGYHNCINAYVRLKEMYKEKIYLYIFAGGESKNESEKEYEAELKALIKENDLEEYVFIKNSVDYSEVRYVFASADIYLCLSTNEPFGITVLESMYMGTPVIATNNGGPSDIISHNQDGILVNSEDSGRISRYILSLLYDENLRKRILINSRKLIVNEYSWESKAFEFYNAYINILKQTHKESNIVLSDHVFLTRNL